MKRSALSGRRLHAQQIARPTLPSPADVVAWFGALQAQDYAGAKWAVALRTRGADVTDAVIERALATGALIRTHALRGTWHLVHPNDVRWMLSLARPRFMQHAARRLDELGLDAATLRACRTVLTRAFRSRPELTRDEIAAELGRARIVATGPRLSHLLVVSEVDGLICSGARRGKSVTYAWLDARVPSPARALTPDESIAELARRYFRSHGPATPSDFTWWSGLTARDARLAIDAVRSDLVALETGGQVHYTTEGSVATERPANVAHALPPFDEYLVGYRNRDAVLDPDHVARVNAGGGMLDASMVVDGRVIATWRRKLGKNEVAIDVAVFEATGVREERAIRRAGERYARFVGLDPRVRIVRTEARRPSRS